MIIRMRAGAESGDVEFVVARLRSLGLSAHLSYDGASALIGLSGPVDAVPVGVIQRWRGVERVLPTNRAYRLASTELRPERTEVRVGDVAVGRDVVVIAGPCSVEGRDQVLRAADGVKQAGATMLRGGAFKPRTSPYSFQGLAEEGLKYLAEAREETGLAVVTEVMAPEFVPMVSDYADVLQIGARNVQNFALLAAVGHSEKPVLLKRGMMSTIEEWLLSAEYILSAGNPNVILCERGIRTFETTTRNTLDISAVPAVQELSHLPMLVDPSHSTGKRSLVTAVSRAAVAAGADGLLIECHPDPDNAQSDGYQSITPAQLSDLIGQCRAVAEAVGRNIA
jgi:3-deoxy-7-phosphoheptulonate synthase